MKKILASTFVIILLAPALVWISGLQFGIPMERIGLKPPRLNGGALLDSDYYRSFDQYFNDVFSLRNPMLFTKKWLDYRLFRTTDADAVHVGEHGWLFSRRSIEDYRKKACREAPVVEKLVLELHAVEKIMAASGRRLFFTVAPNKSTVYPEFVGLVPRNKACNRSRYDLLLEAMAAAPLKGFVRLDEQLQGAKKNGALLYDTTRVEWNDRGARVAAEALQEGIFDAFGENRIFNCRSSAATGDGDLHRRLMGFLTETDDAPAVHRRDSGRPGLASAIIYGDAFIKNLIPCLQEMVGRLEVIRSDSVLSGYSAENLGAADLVLLERAESELDTLHIDVDNVFATFEAQARIPVQSHLNLRAVLPGAQVSLQPRADGLEIKSLGAQAFVHLNAVPASDARVFRVLKLTLEAPHNDVMTIQCNTDPPLIFEKYLRPATMHLYLPLPFQPSVSLDIQPGRKAGVLVLRSAKVLELSESPDAAEPLQPEMPAEGNNLKTAGNAAGVESEKIVAEKGGVDAAADNPSPAPRPADDPPGTAADPGAKSHAITVNDFAEGRIFQRHGQSAHVIVSGTYTGELEAIEARVVESSTFEERLPWTVIDPSPQNGIFVGVLADVPQGGWYNLQVRSRNDHRIAAQGKHKWGVGMLIACLGQSNMKEWFYTGTDLTAHALLSKFSESGWSKLGAKGNAAIAFGNRLVNRLGIPIGLLDYSVNGSGLRKEADWGTGYWEDSTPGSIYSRFIAGVSETGGALEYVIWIQGEADAARGTVTADEYAASLEHFITHQVRSDIFNASDRQQLPFLVVMMIKRPGGKDEPHQAIRDAQKRVAAQVADCYLAATTLDLKNHGRQHLSPSAYITLGKRVAQTVLHILGKETYHRGPQVSNVKQIDGHTLEIEILHSGGSDLRPFSGITGWQIHSGGYSIPILEVERHDPRTLRIHLERPLAGKTEIRYLYGASPDVRGAVLDNSPMSLPLEQHQSEVY